MADGFRYFNKGITLTPTTTPGVIRGDLRVTSTGSQIRFHNGTEETIIQSSPSLYNVRDYGAKGDGVTDDTSAINSAIAAATSGGLIYFPTGTYVASTDITVATSNVKLTGEGSGSVISLADGKKIAVSVSNVIFDNLKITHPDYSTGTNTGILISAAGTSATAYIENIQVLNCNLLEPTFYGIKFVFVKNFRISNNYINRIYYAGIALESCEYGEITNNTIEDILGNDSGNSYGVYVSRSGGSDTTYPRCKNIVVANNVVENNPTWEGLDTHSGDNIIFADNVVRNCKIGITVTRSSSGVSTYPPINCSVIGNIIDSGVSDGSLSSGIIAVGNLTGPDYAYNITIANNTIYRHGDQDSNVNGAIYCYAVRGLSITGNNIYEPGRAGIVLEGFNLGFNISGNLIIDPWSNATVYAEAPAVLFASDSERGSVTGNTFTTGTKSATYVLNYGISFTTTYTSMSVVIGDNFYSGTAANYTRNVTPANGVNVYTLLNRGSATNPSLSFREDTNTGIFSSGPDIFNIATGGISRLQVSSTGACALGTVGSTVTHVLNSGFLSLAAGSATTFQINHGSSNAVISIVGGNSAGDGGEIQLFGGTHGSAASQIRFRQAGLTVGSIASGVWTLGSTSSTAQHVINGLAATTATAGTVAATPANVVEFLTITFNGNTRKIPLYAN